jgi:hypothetical protein
MRRQKPRLRPPPRQQREQQPPTPWKPQPAEDPARLAHARRTPDLSNPASIPPTLQPDVGYGPEDIHTNSLGRATPSASRPPTFDPALSPVVRNLLIQQAEIQARLAELLPARHVPSGSSELGMLRHKLKALEALAESQRSSPHPLNTLRVLTATRVSPLTPF